MGRLWSLSSPLFALGILGVDLCSYVDSGECLFAFFSVLLVWGWIELAFLSGVITGPERRTCPEIAQGWAVSSRWHTLVHHELLLLCGFLSSLVLRQARKHLGFWAYSSFSQRAFRRS